MKYTRIAVIIALVLLLNAAFAYSQSRELKKIVADKKTSQISYTMTHPLHEWTGTSTGVNCIMLYDINENKIASVAVSVMLSSFDSKNSNRDSHALEVLEALKYPSVKFVSNNIQQSDNEITISGNLTFHNVTKPISILAERKKENNKTNISGSFNVNITNYQIEVPSLMGFKTSEEILLNFKIVYSLPEIEEEIKNN